MNDFTKYQTAVRALEALENGNRKDAKRIAKRLSDAVIYEAARELMGWRERKATRAARYLKSPSQETYDAYCNA